MYAVTRSNLNIQRSVCMLMSAAIVTISLALGAYGAQMQPHGYSVTVTQLQ